MSGCEQFKYEDENGNTLYIKNKSVQGDNKRYWFDPELGNTVRRVLYHLPELIDSVGAGKPIFITEGEKDVETLRALGYTATCNFDGGGQKWRSEYDKYFAGAGVYVITDVDKPGQELAANILSHLICVAMFVAIVDVAAYGIELPANGDVSDLKEAIGSEKLKFWLDRILESPENHEAVEYHSNVWYSPEHFVQSIVPPTFHAEWLPISIRDYVMAFAATTQVAPEMVASVVLAIISYIASKHFLVLVRDEWYEPANLFFLIVAKSGERKSAVMDKVGRPLLSYQEKWNQSHAWEISESRQEHERLEREVKALKKKADEDEQARAKLEEAYHTLQNHEVLRAKRMVADDITVEKTASLMAENGGKLLILSSENTFLQTVTRRYSKHPNYDLVLKGYSAETVCVDRITRTSEMIEHAALTICISTQPHVAEELYRNPEYSSRGLLARFLMCIPESRIGKRAFDVPPMDKNAKKAWFALVYALLDRVEKQEKGVVVELSEEAKHLFCTIYETVEEWLNQDEPLIEEFDAKFCGHVSRLALVMHLCDNPEGQEKISDHTLHCAYELGKFFRESLLAMCGSIGSDSITKTATDVLKKLRKNRTEIVSQRDLGRMMQRISMEEREKVIQKLVATGWIRPIQAKGSSIGRNKLPDYEVNPQVFAEPHGSE